MRLSYLQNKDANQLAEFAREHARNMTAIAKHFLSLRDARKARSVDESKALGDAFDAEISRYIKQLQDNLEVDDEF